MEKEKEERLLFLSNDIVCGIFPTARGPIHLVLSPDGEYCLISTNIPAPTLTGTENQDEEYKNVHLTKFVPSRFVSIVRKLVRFRNSFASQAYLNERFPIEISEVGAPSPHEGWVKLDAEGVLEEGYRYSPGSCYDSNNFVYKSYMFICPYNRRIQLVTDVTHKTITSSSSSSSIYSSSSDWKDVDHEPKLVLVRNTQFFPICRLFQFANDGGTVKLVHNFDNPKSKSRQRLSQQLSTFDDVLLELRAAGGRGLMATGELHDGCFYTLSASNISRPISIWSKIPQNMSRSTARGSVDTVSEGVNEYFNRSIDAEEDLEVEVWINCRFLTNELDSFQHEHNDEHYFHNISDEEDDVALNTTGQSSEGAMEDALLNLRGDVFTLHYTLGDKEVPVPASTSSTSDNQPSTSKGDKSRHRCAIDVHVSTLQFLLGNATFFDDYEDEDLCNPGLKLRSSMSNFTKADLYRSIFLNPSMSSNNILSGAVAGDAKLRLFNRVRQHASRLLLFRERLYTRRLELTHHEKRLCTAAIEKPIVYQPDKTGVGIMHKKSGLNTLRSVHHQEVDSAPGTGLGYGPEISMITVDGDFTAYLVLIDLGTAKGSFAYATRHTGISSLSAIGHTIGHQQNFLRTAEAIGKEIDTLLLTKRVQAEHALPSDDSGLGSARQQRNISVVRVRCRFNDRAIGELNLATKFFQILLPDGRVELFSMKAYMERAGISGSGGPGAVRDVEVLVPGQEGEYARRLLAFYRWAQEEQDRRELAHLSMKGMSPLGDGCNREHELVSSMLSLDDRGHAHSAQEKSSSKIKSDYGFGHRDTHTLVRARAEALQNHRHLLMDQIREGILSPTQASTLSTQFQASLMPYRRCVPPPPPPSTPHWLSTRNEVWPTTCDSTANAAGPFTYATYGTSAGRHGMTQQDVESKGRICIPVSRR